MEVEYFNYKYHGFNIYEELYCLKRPYTDSYEYKLTWISVASLRDIMDFYNDDEKLNLFEDLRRIK